MQIPKVSLFVCALALGSLLPVQAEDNPAQAAAMAALNTKMAQLDQQPSNAIPPTVEEKAQAQTTVTQQKKQEKEAAKKAAAKKKADAAAAAQAQKEAAAAQKAEQKAQADQQIATEAQKQIDQQNLAAQKATDMAAMGAAATQVQSQPVQTQQTQVPVQTQVQSAQPVQSSTQLNANQAAAMAALNQTMSTGATTTQPAPSPVIMTTTPGTPAPVMPQTQVASPQPVSQLPFYSAPKAPVSDAKQQQLHALLQKYMANQITPGEYQKQRADILAQP